MQLPHLMPVCPSARRAAFRLGAQRRILFAQPRDHILGGGGCGSGSLELRTRVGLARVRVRLCLCHQRLRPREDGARLRLRQIARILRRARLRRHFAQLR